MRNRMRVDFIRNSYEKNNLKLYMMSVQIYKEIF